MTEYEEITEGKSIFELEKELRFQYSLGYTETDNFPIYIIDRINTLKSKSDKLDTVISDNTYLLYSLANIMEGLSLDIESAMKQKDTIEGNTKKALYAFSIKQTVGMIHRNSVLFRQDLNKHYDKHSEFKLIFGESTDKLQAAIEEVISKIRFK